MHICTTITLLLSAALVGHKLQWMYHVTYYYYYYLLCKIVNNTIVTILLPYWYTVNHRHNKVTSFDNSFQLTTTLLKLNNFLQVSRIFWKTAVELNGANFHRCSVTAAALYLKTLPYVDCQPNLHAWRPQYTRQPQLVLHTCTWHHSLQQLLSVFISWALFLQLLQIWPMLQNRTFGDNCHWGKFLQQPTAPKHWFTATWILIFKF